MADGPIVKGEPICERSREYSELHGFTPDPDDREGRGPHEDCFCDVCFYGHRKHWLAGFAAGVEAAAPRVDDPNAACSTCGHPRSAHIYHEGACRPGFVCDKGCEVFS